MHDERWSSPLNLIKLGFGRKRPSGSILSNVLWWLACSYAVIVAAWKWNEFVCLCVRWNSANALSIDLPSQMRSLIFMSASISFWACFTVALTALVIPRSFVGLLERLNPNICYILAMSRLGGTWKKKLLKSDNALRLTWYVTGTSFWRVERGVCLTTSALVKIFKFSARSLCLLRGVYTNNYVFLWICKNSGNSIRRLWVLEPDQLNSKTYPEIRNCTIDHFPKFSTVFLDMPYFIPDNFWTWYIRSVPKNIRYDDRISKLNYFTGHEKWDRQCNVFFFRSFSAFFSEHV